MRERRIALIGDSHFDASANGRFEECKRIHDWIADDMRSRDVDLVLHSGDVFERRSTPVERHAVADWLTKVAESAPVVIVRGNHDMLGDVALFRRLETRFPIHVEEGANVHVVRDVVIAAMAWPSKASVLAESGGESSDARGALQAVIQGLGADAHRLAADVNEPRIFLAHAMVRGSRTSSGQPLVGCDFEIGTEELQQAQLDFYCLGHIHMPQQWDGAGVPRDKIQTRIAYPGSPRRTAFGEIEEKGYLLLDFENRELTNVQRVPTPCVQMLLRTASYQLGRFVFEGSDDMVIEDGADVRLRYTVGSDEREAARAVAAEFALEWTESFGASVKIEEVVRSTKVAKVPEITGFQTIDDKLRAYWGAGAVAPLPEQELLEMAHDAERAVSDAV